MTNLENYFELHDKLVDIQEKITPLRNELADVNNRIYGIFDSFSLKEKDFFNKKLYNALTEDEKEDIERYNKEIDYQFNHRHVGICYIKNCPFDPYRDYWSIKSYEIEGDKIRLYVSINDESNSFFGKKKTAYSEWFTLKEYKDYIS